MGEFSQVLCFDMSSLEPKDTTTVRWIILHRYSEEGSWVPTWVGELCVDGSDNAHEQEIAAHKALDRIYPAPFVTRLVKQTHRNIREVEDVPAMWED